MDGPNRAIVEGTMVPLVICGMISMALYGGLIMQAFRYFTYYPEDKCIIKLTVALVLLLESVEQAFLIHTACYYLVYLGVSNINLFTKANWSLLGRNIPTEMSGFLVECFFVVRVWILADSKAYLALFFPVMVSSALGYMTIIHLFQYPTFKDAPTSVPYITSWCSARAISDICIAAAVCRKLYSSRDGVSATFKSVLARIFLFSLTTGILTSFFAFLVLITYLFLPFEFVYAGIYLIHGKIYSISLLASLNNRHSLRARASHPACISTIDVTVYRVATV